MKYKIIIFILFFNQEAIFPQAPVIQWQKCYGGSGRDWANTMVKTYDGGFVVGGFAGIADGDITSVNGGDDMWIIKIDSLGALQWQKCYGAYLGDEEAKSIKQTPDSGFIIAGTATRNGGDVSGLHQNVAFTDFWIVKISKNGNLQWQKCLGGTDNDTPYDIELTSDGGYIVVGETASGDGDITNFYGGYDAWVAKIDSIGNLQWQKNLGGFMDDAFFSVKEADDGRYILAMNSGSFDGILSCNHGIGTTDCFIAKLDSLGNYLWGKCLGGSNGDSPLKILLLNDGSFIIGAGTTSNDGDVSGLNGPVDIWLVKTDSLANLQWQKCFGGSSYDYLNTIKKTSDGGYIMAGMSESDDYPAFCDDSTWYKNFWVVKVDSSGNYQWSKCMGGTYDDEAFEIEEVYDGAYLIGGYTASNDGDVSGYHTSGNCNSSYPCEDYWVVKLAPLGTSIVKSNSISDFSLHFNNSTQTLAMSTIAGENTKAEMQLFDVIGRKILNQAFELQAGLNKKEIRAGDLNSGIYLVRLATDSGAVVKKLMVE